jgi:hypothetical protein
MTDGARVWLETISKRFGAPVGVDGVSLTVEPGVFLTLTSLQPRRLVLLAAEAAPAEVAR